MEVFGQYVHSLYGDGVQKVFNPDRRAFQNPKGTEMNDPSDLRSHGEKAWNTRPAKRKTEKKTVIPN
jgi:hypothetical protein